MPQQQNPWERDYGPVLRGMEGLGPEPIVPLRPRADAAPTAQKTNPWERDYAPPVVRYNMPEPPGPPRIPALQPGAPGPPTPATGLELTGAAFKGFVVNPLKGLWEMGKRVAQGPEETGRLAEEIWNQQLATGRRAAQAWQEGDRSSAVGYALGSLIPLLGPAAAGLGDRLGESFAKAQMDPSAANQKQLAEDLGEASNLILQAPMSRAAAPGIEMARGGVVGGIKSVPKAVGSMAEGAMYGMAMGEPLTGAGIGALKTLREGVAKGAKEAWQSRQARLAAERQAIVARATARLAKQPQPPPASPTPTPPGAAPATPAPSRPAMWPPLPPRARGPLFPSLAMPKPGEPLLAPSPKTAPVIAATAEEVRAFDQSRTPPPSGAHLTPEARAAYDYYGIEYPPADEAVMPAPPTRSQPVPPEPSVMPPPAARPTASLTGLDQMGGGMAQAMTENLYGALWEKLQKGDVTEAGRPSALLQAAKRIRDRGGMQSMADLQALAQDYQQIAGTQGFQQKMQALVQKHSPTPAPAAVPPPAPPPSPTVPSAQKAAQRMRQEMGLQPGQFETPVIADVPEATGAQIDRAARAARQVGFNPADFSKVQTPQLQELAKSAGYDGPLGDFAQSVRKRMEAIDKATAEAAKYQAALDRLSPAERAVTRADEAPAAERKPPASETPTVTTPAEANVELGKQYPAPAPVEGPAAPTASQKRVQGMAAILAEGEIPVEQLRGGLKTDVRARLFLESESQRLGYGKIAPGELDKIIAEIERLRSEAPISKAK